MMTTIRVALYLIVVCGAQVTSDTLLSRLQGDWQLEKAVSDGRTLPPQEVVFKIKGTEMIPSDRPTDVAKIKIDDSVSPQQIELLAAGDSRPSLGIIRLDGDRLELCMAEPGKARPKEFKSPTGTTDMLWVLKRKAKQP